MKMLKYVLLKLLEFWGIEDGREKFKTKDFRYE